MSFIIKMVFLKINVAFPNTLALSARGVLFFFWGEGRSTRVPARGIASFGNTARLRNPIYGDVLTSWKIRC